MASSPMTMATKALPSGFATLASLKKLPFMRRVLVLRPASRLLRFGVGIDHVASLVLLRPDDDLMVGVLELIDRIAGDMLELGEENARLRPFAVLAERDVADHG